MPREPLRMMVVAWWWRTDTGAEADGRTPVRRGSVVTLDGQVQRWEAREAAREKKGAAAEFLYLKYWKPAGVTCTADASATPRGPSHFVRFRRA